MSIITYDDILFVMKTDSIFCKKMLTVKFLKDLKEKYPGYNRELEEYFFYEAAGFGNKRVLKYLLNELNDYPAYKSNINAALNRAIDREHYSLAIYLLKLGADPASSDNFVVEKCVKGPDPLVYNRIRKQRGCLKVLKWIKKNTDFDFKFKNETLLWSASDWSTVRFLIEVGLRRQDYMDRLLDQALQRNNIYMVNYLLEKGADPEHCKYSYVKYVCRS